MTDQEKLQRIIVTYTPLRDYKKINLYRTIKNTYIAEEDKLSFCSKIVNKWPNIGSTALEQDMFASLKTGDDILKRINNRT